MGKRSTYLNSLNRSSWKGEIFSIILIFFSSLLDAVPPLWKNSLLEMKYESMPELGWYSMVFSLFEFIRNLMMPKCIRIDKKKRIGDPTTP